jgi:HSP20 family molecular chaperone IbpA
MDDDDFEVERVKSFLNSNGYLVRKSDVAWILRQMAEALQRQTDEANGVIQRQLLCEVITTAKEVKIITELPGVSEDRIEINAYDNKLEINAENEKRSFYEIIHVLVEADTKVLKSTFLNGFLEVTLKKKIIHERTMRKAKYEDSRTLLHEGH